jgi:hypothetical protein
MKKQKFPGFACFSPPVMLATFVIEIVLLIFTLMRYKKSKPVTLVGLVLFCLAFFQMSEYFVCGGLGLDAKLWSRMGFIAITLLPPLGVHIVQVIAKKENRLVTCVAYLTGIAWVLIFGLSEAAFVGHMCAGNYAIFQFIPVIAYAYGIYYYGWLVSGIYLAMKFRRGVKSKKISQALLGIVIGYLLFMAPTGIVNLIDPLSVKSIPSVMCGFAVIYALILAGYILPLIAKAKTTRR